MKKNKNLLRVGLAQTDAVPGDPSGNIAKVKKIVNEQRDELDFLMFPEYAISGYVMGDKVYECAIRTEDEMFADLMACTRDITVAFGFVEETGSFNFYNSLAIVRDRQILAVHRKIYLVNYGNFEERKHFSVGPSHDCFDIDPFRVAPFICGDAWNPMMVHLAAADRAHVFLFPACSPSGGLGSRLSTKESWRRLNRFYASTYGVYVLFVNRVGKDQNLELWGGSEIIDPFGKEVVAAKEAEEEVITAELDLSQVRESRTVLHTVRDEDLGFVRRRLEKVINRHYL